LLNEKKIKRMVPIANKVQKRAIKLDFSEFKYDSYAVLVWLYVCGVTGSLLLRLKVNSVVKAETIEELEQCSLPDTNVIHEHPYRNLVIATVCVVAVVTGVALGVYFYGRSNSNSSDVTQYANIVEQNRDLFEQINRENLKLKNLSTTTDISPVIAQRQMSGIVTDLGEHLRTSERFLISPYIPEEPKFELELDFGDAITHIF
jgi:hypothetical protein